MPTTPVPEQTRDELSNIIRDLQKQAMKPGIPIPQMIALKNRAQELFDQLIELDAAEFNAEAANYMTAIQGLEATILDLRKSLEEIDDAIDHLEKAAAVFKALDGVLKVAARFV